MAPRVGLVLTGGGARGAYQAGVLRGISEFIRGPMPFTVLTGASAGALSVMAIAAAAEDFGAGTIRLWERWASISHERVFRTDALTVAKIGSRWIRDIALGGLLHGVSSTHLLDASPLRQMLLDSIDFADIASNIERGLIEGIGLTATDYASGAAVTFCQSHTPTTPWMRCGRCGRSAQLGVDHVMASAAIPLFFPPVKLEGSYFGDGCIRLTAPLSPAIHLGADRILAIGLQSDGPSCHPPESTMLESATVAEIAGAVVNAIFMDGLSADIERLTRINRFVAKRRPGDDPDPDNLRFIPVLALRPSQDLRSFAANELARLPAVSRYLLRGLGADGERGWDLLSYLAFDSAYAQRLLDLGYEDALDRRAEIRTFFEATPSLRRVA